METLLDMLNAHLDTVEPPMNTGQILLHAGDADFDVAHIIGQTIELFIDSSKVAKGCAVRFVSRAEE